MKANFVRAALAVSLVASSAWAQVQTPATAPAVMTIGTQAWSAERFALLRAAGGPSEALSAAQLAGFVDQFAERYRAARQAEAAGLAGDPRVAERLALARNRVLADEERTRLQNAAPIDAARVRAEFEAHPGAFDELRLSHILVRITDQNQAVAPAQRRTDAQALARARSIQRQLTAGANFNALARRYSDDDSSGPAGGELPVIFGKDLKPEVQATVKALAPGQVSAPVRGPDGYHLIRLEERSVTDFEGARRQLDLALREAWAERQLARLRADAPVTFDAARAQALEAARLESAAGQ